MASHISKRDARSCGASDFLDRHDYQAAAGELQKVLQVAPTSQKAILLAAKADILNCDLSGAQKALDLRQTYKNDELFSEVNGTWQRAVKGYENAVKATKLAEDDKHEEEAAQLMAQASREYRECQDLKVAAETYAGGADFVRKNYDGFLAHSSAALQMSPNDPGLIAGEASALAAKYAITGLTEFRSKAEDDLQKAEKLSQADSKLKSSYNEYVERIRYRLQSREIIDRDEYNRRFRGGKDPLKGSS